jgi:hypothetical protein
LNFGRSKDTEVGVTKVTGIVTAACWMDLRAYAEMISSAGFDPSCTEAKLAISRLRTFQRVVAEHSDTTFPTLSVNDGVVAYRDIGIQPNNLLFDFLRKTWDLYRAAMEADSRYHDAGLRGVLAVGLRARGSKRGMDAQEQEFASILTALDAGELDLASAITRSRRIYRLHDVVPPLQANFAFTKAYEAEKSGKDSGFAGANLFADMTIFNDGIPAWLDCSLPFSWPAAGPLSSNYVAIKGFRDVDRSEGSHALRSGREILALIARH